MACGCTWLTFTKTISATHMLPDKLKRRRRWKQTSGVSVRPVITPRWPNVRAYRCFARFSCGFGDQLSSLLPARLAGGCTLLFGESRRRRTCYCGKEYRRSSIRKPERRKSQRLLCRRHPGRDSDALIQDRRFEGDLAHLHAAL